MAGSALIVDAEVSFREGIARMLNKLGLSVQEAADFEEARRRLETSSFDVVILDVGLRRAVDTYIGENADAEGYDLLDRIRSRPQHQYIAMIVVSDKEYESDSLNHDSDDFVRRDVTPAALEAHVKKALRTLRLIRRRPGTYGPERIGSPLLQAGIFFMDQNRMLRIADGDLIKLTEFEAQIFSFMAAHPGQNVTVSDLKRHLVQAEPFSDTVRVDLLMRSLQKKLRRVGGYGLLTKVRPISYRLEVSFPRVAA